MNDSALETRKEGNVHILAFKDKLTYAKLDAIKMEISSNFSFTEMGNTLIDLSDIRILDSAGIGLLVSLYKSSIKAQGKFAIVSTNSSITDILKTVGVNRIIKIHPTMEEALKSF